MDGIAPRDDTVQAWIGVVEPQGLPRAVGALPACFGDNQRPCGDVPFPAFAQRDHAVKTTLTHQPQPLGQ